MARRKAARKKTRKELADPDFKRRQKRQTQVVRESHFAADSLPKKRKDFLGNIACYEWVYRCKYDLDSPEYKKERRYWDRQRDKFLREATKPLELHWFAVHWSWGEGSTPLRKIVSSPYCDAGTALRIYWLAGPYYYQEYRSISECYGEEKEFLRILRTIERRFRRSDFVSAKIPFDPEPWVTDRYAESAVHKIPAEMYQPIGRRRKK